MLNRILKMDRIIEIDLEKKALENPSEHGDTVGCQKKHDNNMLLSRFLNKQSNA